MKTKTTALAALLAALAAPLAAQPAPPLTLAEALRLAREHNPQYRKALNQVESADADRRTRLGAFFPSLSVAVNSGGSYNRSYTGVDDFGNPTTLEDPRESRSSSMRQSVSLGSLTLFDGGVKLRDYRAAQAAAAGARFGVAAEELRLRGELERRYWKAVEAERLIALEERLLETAREQLDATRRLVSVAVRTPVDVLAAEVKVAEQELALERARGERRRAELDLRQEIGVIEGPPRPLADEPAAPFDPAPLDADALLAAAFAANPRLDRAEAGVRAAEQRLGAARAGRFPTLSLTAGAGRATNVSGYDALVEPNPLDQSYSFGFQLNVPLFTQFATSGRIAQARATRNGAQEDARAERLAVERDVRSALIELENAFRAAGNAERSLRLNRQRLELAQEQYRLGALSFTELQDAVSGTATAEREALKARFTFAAALATLEEKVGAPVERP
ncbi:MAG TPA: TolC family protein [Longimicrobiaceae bacterium]|nr:TolC family protein [Longimicrobiaceae bacterium]